MKEIRELLEDIFQEDTFTKIIFSNKRKKSLPYKKVMIRPVELGGSLLYQIEFTFENKVTHENIKPKEAIKRCLLFIANDFKQINIFTDKEEIQVLAAKAENPRITGTLSDKTKTSDSCDPHEGCANCKEEDQKNEKDRVLSHNREKNYIIPNGVPCDFLLELGVMSPEGNVYPKYYSKFRQINRFLEIAADTFSALPSQKDAGQRPLRIIDFGCGKAYLTFALYHYLKIMKGRNVEIIGLDLKADVIEFCNNAANNLGYENLSFSVGDIADYKNDYADMVVTLHACDTATDFALINAVQWNAKVILSVPCCQHELFKQIKNPVNGPMLKHGIIKDKFTELLTDGLRGLKLEACGYDVSMIEFTSLEHTSKNIMIKALKTGTPANGKSKKAQKEYEALKAEYSVQPAIDGLTIPHELD